MILLDKKILYCDYLNSKQHKIHYKSLYLGLLVRRKTRERREIKEGVNKRVPRSKV